MNKSIGSLIGLACGDALGTTLEFTNPLHHDTQLTDMIGGGPFDLEPGQWTDDTSMALCLADSLIDCNKFDPNDQLIRYVKWRDYGYLSSTGTCFDIGLTVSSALREFVSTGRTSHNPDIGSSGNGSLMRIAPIAIAYSYEPLLAIQMAYNSSITTHSSILCTDSCRLYTGLIVAALNKVPKEMILSPNYKSAGLLNWKHNELVKEVNDISLGSYKTKNPPSIKGTGYVIDSMEAALWAFYNTENFKDGALLAVNLCDDADTTGAIYGQLAGAYYGLDNIPIEWVEKLTMDLLIKDIAIDLYNLYKNEDFIK